MPAESPFLFSRTTLKRFTEYNKQKWLTQKIGFVISWVYEIFGVPLWLTQVHGVRRADVLDFEIWSDFKEVLNIKLVCLDSYLAILELPLETKAVRALSQT